MRSILTVFGIIGAISSLASTSGFAKEQGKELVTKNVACDFSIPTARGAAEGEKNVQLKAIDLESRTLEGKLVIDIDEKKSQTFELVFNQTGGLNVSTTVNGVAVSSNGETYANFSIRSAALKIDISCDLKQ